MTGRSAICWICRIRPANSAEHRFKASDIRLKAADVTQLKPIYLQRDGATNIRVGSSKSSALTFDHRICSECNNKATQPYDRAWERLSRYLQENWTSISRRGQFDLAKTFPGATRSAALDVHLYFVKLFGCKLNEDSVDIDLKPFSDALTSRTPHPEISVIVSDVSSRGMGKFLMSDSQVHVWADHREVINAAVWFYVIYPVAIKIGWTKSGAHLHLLGHKWHPSSSSKHIKLSTFEVSRSQISRKRVVDR